MNKKKLFPKKQQNVDEKNIYKSLKETTTLRRMVPFKLKDI